MKNGPKPKSIRNIQVILGYASFYQHFIHGLSKLTRPLISMLKTTTTKPAKNLLVSGIWLRMLRLEVKQAQ